MDKDLRKEIWGKEIDGLNHHMISSSNIYNAMDEYFKQRAMELLEWMADNVEEIDRFDSVGDAVGDGKGVAHFFYKSEFLTKEELFKNFL